MPVGAVATYLVTLTARTSARIGAAAALGVAAADGLYALIAVLGGRALAGAIERIATPLRWIAAGVLVVVAVRIAWTAIRDYRRAAGDDRALPPGAGGSAGRVFATFLGITLLNPATIVYFAALVLGSRATGASAGGGTIFVVAVFVASASWQLLLVAGGTALGRTVTGRTGRLLTGLVSSALILALTAVLVLAD
jgi:arginine exporter protein ArgO